VLTEAPCYQPSFSPDGERVVCSLVEESGADGKRQRESRRVAVIGVPAELR
jgi:hypothetical protein